MAIFFAFRLTGDDHCSDLKKTFQDTGSHKERDHVIMRQATASLPLGIIIRRSPSVSRWVPFSWKVIAVVPGAGSADWQPMREEDGVVEFHAATVPLELWRTDTEAYLHGLSARTPTIGVVLREVTDPDAQHPLEVVLATASPYETQDYTDSGEELVELVAMPEGLVAYVRDFVNAHHEHEEFVKRRRDKKRIDLNEEGIGDARIAQLSDVYSVPHRRKARLQ